MRHIRNFFHNINDILLAIIIVAIAAGIIYWRMQIILDYPEQAVKKQVSTEQSASDTDAVDETGGSESPEETDPEEDKAQ